MSWLAAGLILGLCVLAGVISMLRSHGDIGRDEGTERGPRGGEGAVLHESSGERDFDGTGGDVLPPRKEHPPESYPTTPPGRRP